MDRFCSSVLAWMGDTAETGLYSFKDLQCQGLIIPHCFNCLFVLPEHFCDCLLGTLSLEEWDLFLHIPLRTTGLD